MLGQPPSSPGSSFLLLLLLLLLRNMFSHSKTRIGSKPPRGNVLVWCQPVRYNFRNGRQNENNIWDSNVVPQTCSHTARQGSDQSPLGETFWFDASQYQYRTVQFQEWKWWLWKRQKENNTWDSNVVPHRSTNQARTCLTSLSGREAVLSCWYGRSQQTSGSEGIQSNRRGRSPSKCNTVHSSLGALPRTFCCTL
jgi:hypothetical protein